jgi:hypothetical protein
MAALLAVPAAVVANDTWEDQPVTEAERAKVIAALEAAGCSDPREIERDDDGYEADDVRCADGVFDIDLDKEFKIIDRDREDR